MPKYLIEGHRWVSATERASILLEADSHDEAVEAFYEMAIWHRTKIHDSDPQELNVIEMHEVTDAD